MAAIRPFAADDAPAVAALFARVYPGSRWESDAACEAYFREMLLESPWRDPEIPSWVAEDGGRIEGFCAMQARPMLLSGRRLRAAVACQFMVSPEGRLRLLTMKLLQACLRGPQDLTIADGATAEARDIWVGLGESAPLLYALHWTRPLRPARFLLGRARARGALSAPAALAARPAGALLDAIAASLPANRFAHDEALAEQALDATTMATYLPDLLHPYALQPVYAAHEITWMLEQLRRKRRHGRLRSVALRDDRRLLGWYLYYVLPGDVAEVVQIVAHADAFDRVLVHLLADARRERATAVRGRLDPHFVRELSQRQCWLRTDGTWTVVHSRNADVLNAVHRGEAFLSRLEGEWWMRFHGEPGTSAASRGHRAPAPALPGVPGTAGHA